VNARARFLRLRILENHGNRTRTGLGEVELIEGQTAGYVSVLSRIGSSASSSSAVQELSIEDRNTVEEREPNNTRAKRTPSKWGAG